MWPLRQLDRWIDRLSMYRLLVYYLAALLVVAGGFSLGGVLGFTLVALIISIAVLVSTCLLVNRVLSYLYEVPCSDESAIITALILALIITPDYSRSNLLSLLIVSGIAMASKYVFAVRQQHIFNPAAIAVLLTAAAGGLSASWWIGNAALIPLVMAGGLLLIRKVRRGSLLVCYIAAAGVATVVVALVSQQLIADSLRHLFVGSALWFMGFVMLTEPFTSPTAKRQSMLYGALVGALLPPPLHIFGYYSSPEAALSIGNLFARVVTPSSRRALRLIATEHLTHDTYDFIFVPSRPLRYQPGQYMELTVPHAHPDSRGIRRYLTLASSPTEATIRFGMKVIEGGSSYKAALQQLDPGTALVAAQLRGDFTLPVRRSEKLLFIAGGIGITPFRSMVQYLLDTHDYRDIVLLYTAHTTADIAYAPLWAMANTTFGLKVVYVLSREVLTSIQSNVSTYPRIDAVQLQSDVPKLAERLCYISGTHDMTTTVAATLQQLGVPGQRIKSDFFPGYM